MDVIRSAIEAVFYHLPLESVAEIICAKGSGDNVRLLELISDIMYREFKEFTSYDIKLFSQVMQNDWLCDVDINFNPLGHNYVQSKQLLERLPLLINEFSKNVLLTPPDSTPTVQFNHLLRWRMISLLVGEDLLTIPFIARQDKDRKFKRKDFLWQNILSHDNFRLNAILDDTLSDIHSHINGAQDVFEFNWLIMMNYSNYFYQKDEFEKNSEFIRSTNYRMEYDRVNRFSPLSLSLYDWMNIAAAIRVYLFYLLDYYDSISRDGKKVFNPLITEDDIKAGIVDTSRLRLLGNFTQSMIGSLSKNAIKAENLVMIDYAIRKGDFIDKIPNSPYLIHHGERSLLYRWFRGYYSREPLFLNSTDIMMLYLLIKSKIRREFIQTNTLCGFENFQVYQSSKTWGLETFKSLKDFKDQAIVLKRSMFKYAIQSSIGNNPKNHIEARVVPASVEEFRDAKLHEAIFGSENFMDESDLKFVSVVAHFIKTEPRSNNKNIRHEDIRNKLWEEVHVLADIFSSQKKEERVKPMLTGIDAASSELVCRPEVFAPMYRFLRFKGLTNFTFHAGEDFFDLLDGIRTVYETIFFMGYTIGCRIGHGLALGLNARNFYEERHLVIMIPSQILMDNLVWMKYFAASVNITLSPQTQMLIDEQFASLIQKLGYLQVNGFSGNMWYYWQSMLLRGDFVSPTKWKSAPYTAEVMFSPISPLRNNSEKIKSPKDKDHTTESQNVVLALHDFYEKNTSCRNEGNIPVMIKVPSSFALDVTSIQNAMLDILEEKGVVIETNPSSNLKIGRFNRYDMHPITLFHEVGNENARHAMVVTINTDDKGVFATSLTNEYSLIALSLQKQRDEKGNRKWTDLQIEEYLRRIAHYGNISQFKV